MEWIRVGPSGHYFCTESLQPWTPIGHNEAVNWPELHKLFLHKSIHEVEQYFIKLNAHGVTCIRIMMEYCQNNYYYLEKPVGQFQKKMIDFWDHFFKLCELYNVRVLLTPFDTYWMWRRWKYHPYNTVNGGMISKKADLLKHPHSLHSIQVRFEFFIKKWGNSGVIFGWDLWNEIHPRYCKNNQQLLENYITKISHFIRNLEQDLYGKSHLQTVSSYGNNLINQDCYGPVLLRNPLLDFATIHLYEKGTLDNPKNAVEPALAASKLIEAAIKETHFSKPFLDSEHGPIYKYVRSKKELNEEFDDQYFKNIQWAHIATGATGGGMRWPYRKHHQLTGGMHHHQKMLALFCTLFPWNNFHRKVISKNIILSNPDFVAIACASEDAVVTWLLRVDFKKRKQGNKKESTKETRLTITIPNLMSGAYQIIEFNTINGSMKKSLGNAAENRILQITISIFESDVALAMIKIKNV